MGAGNAKLVYVRWSHLDGHAFRLLVFMALVTKDIDHPPRYWDRWESLAIALGRVVPDQCDGDETGRLERQAALRAVNRATADLVSAQAVTIVQRASPGRNTVYELNLDGTVDADRRVNNSQPSMERSTVSGRNGRRSVVERSTVSGQTVDANRPSPRKDNKEEKDLTKEEKAGVKAAVTVSRARKAATNKPASSPSPTADGDSQAAGDITPRDSRCRHGNSRRRRRDGTPRCDQCRTDPP